MEPEVKLPFILDVAIKLLEDRILQAQNVQEQNNIRFLIQHIEDGDINIHFNDINYIIIESYDLPKYKITSCEFNSNIVEDFILYGELNNPYKVKIRQFINSNLYKTTVTQLVSKQINIILHDN